VYFRRRHGVKYTQIYTRYFRTRFTICVRLMRNEGLMRSQTVSGPRNVRSPASSLSSSSQVKAGKERTSSNVRFYSTIEALKTALIDLDTDPDLGVFRAYFPCRCVFINYTLCVLSRLLSLFTVGPSYAPWTETETFRSTCFEFATRNTIL
jgi:hypothetical protein